MYKKGVYVINAHFLLTRQLILRFVGSNYGHVKAADESQIISFCFKYYGGWIRGPTISIAEIPNKCTVLSSIKFFGKS